MVSVANTKILPEALGTTWARVSRRWSESVA